MLRQVVQDQKASVSGTNVAISCASSASTLQIANASNTKYSWGLKFRMSNKTATFPCVIFGKTSTKYPLQLRVETNGVIRAAAYDGTNNPVATSNKLVTDYQWHTAVGVRDGSSISLFLDGVFVATTTATLGSMSEASSVLVGGNTFVGNIKNAFVTLNAMTAEEVANYHAFDKLLGNNLIEYRLNEGAGTTAYDSSGNGNSGAITNFSWSVDTPTKKRKTINDNLAYNGDFEYAPPFVAATTTQYRTINGTAAGAGGAENIFGWGIAAITGSASAQYDNGALKLSTTATGSKIDVKYLSNNSYKFPFIPLLPNTSYTLTGRIKTSLISGGATTGARLQALALNSSMTTVNTYTAVNGLVSTTGWTEYKVTFTTSSSARYLDIALSVVGNDGASTLIMDAWFDDIVVKLTAPSGRLVTSDTKSSLLLDAGKALNTNMLMGTTFSAAFWVKPTGFGLYNSLFMATGGNQQLNFARDNSSKQYYLYVITDSVADIVMTLPNNQIPIHLWSRIVITATSNNIKCYLNGVLVGTNTAKTIKSPTGTIRLGETNTSPTGFSDFILENGVLWTQEQVTADYLAGNGASSPTARLPLDEGVGAVAYDKSGNGNNGTITSGSSWTRDTPRKKRTTVNDNMIYNGDFSIAPPTNVPQTSAYKWLDGTAAGKIVNGTNVSNDRVPGIYFWDIQSSGAIMIDTTNKFNGKNSLKVSTTATNAYVITSLGDFNRDDYIPVLPNTSYTYSFWMKTNYVSGDGVSGAYIDFVRLTGARGGSSVLRSTTVKTTTDWTQYTGTFTTASDRRYIVVRPTVEGSTGTATLIMDAWFADIQLRPTTAITRTAA